MHTLNLLWCVERRASSEALTRPLRQLLDGMGQLADRSAEAPNWGKPHETPKPLKNSHFHEENSPILRAMGKTDFLEKFRGEACSHQEANKRPAKGQHEASKRPARGQDEASKRSARGQQEASKRLARDQQEASKRPTRGQQEASKKPRNQQEARRSARGQEAKRPARGQEAKRPGRGPKLGETPRNTETIEKQPFS